MRRRRSHGCSWLHAFLLHGGGNVTVEQRLGVDVVCAAGVWNSLETAQQCLESEPPVLAVSSHFLRLVHGRNDVALSQGCGMVPDVHKEHRSP